MPESLEQRQAAARRYAEHEARQADHIAAEQRTLAALHRAQGFAPGEPRRIVIGQKAGQGPSEDKSLPGPAENKEQANALAGVDFASDAAAELAMRAGLRAKDFKGKEPSGVSGFTKADVQNLIGA